MDTPTRLWKLLWDFDPNGLLVLDERMVIKLVNPALCRMLKREAATLLGRPGAEVLGDITDFQRAYAERVEIVGQEQAYPQFDLYARKVIFPVPDEQVVAGIFVDMTGEWKQQQELQRLKHQAIQEVRQVVDKQMSVAQEIAGLLGETTAETKVSLLRLLDMIRRENA
jgi:PAS domain-containing protein